VRGQDLLRKRLRSRLRLDRCQAGRRRQPSWHRLLPRHAELQGRLVPSV